MASFIEAGKGKGGDIDFSTSILRLTGGKSGAPRARIDQLKRLQRDTAAEEFIIGGGAAEGAFLDLEERDPEETHNGDPASDPEPSVIRSGGSQGGEIKVRGKKFEATGGKGHAPRVRLSQICKAKLVSGATGVVVEGGEGNGAVIIIGS